MTKAALIVSILSAASIAWADATRARNGALFSVETPPPSLMVPGSTATVSITMQNTGSASWTAAAGYKLGAWNPKDNANWTAGRVVLGSAANVGTFAAATFTFRITAPATPGTYSYQWRMVQEKVAWFGQFSPWLSVKVSTEPSAGSKGRIDAGDGCSLTLVRQVHEQVKPGSSVAGAFEVAKRVAWALKGGGLLLKPAGDNIVTWRGQSFSAGRICHPASGHIWKVVSAVGGTDGVECLDNGYASPGKCVPSVDPSLP